MTSSIRLRVFNFLILTLEEKQTPVQPKRIPGGAFALLRDHFHDVVNILCPIDNLDIARLDDVVARALI
jgi:hypothetical protein